MLLACAVDHLAPGSEEGGRVLDLAKQGDGTAGVHPRWEFMPSGLEALRADSAHTRPVGRYDQT